MFWKDLSRRWCLTSPATKVSVRPTTVTAPPAAVSAPSVANTSTLPRTLQKKTVAGMTGGRKRWTGRGSGGGQRRASGDGCGREDAQNPTAGAGKPVPSSSSHCWLSRTLTKLVWPLSRRLKRGFSFQDGWFRQPPAWPAVHRPGCACDANKRPINTAAMTDLISNHPKLAWLVVHRHLREQQHAT